MIEKRKGHKFPLSDSDPDKVIVSTVEWQGSIYVATQKGIYRIGDNDTLIRLKFIEKEAEKKDTYKYLG